MKVFTEQTKCDIILFAATVFAVLYFFIADAGATRSTFKTGTIAAKGLVLDPDGKPVWAEYNKDGKPVGIIEADMNCTVMSANAYNAYVSAFKNLSFPKDYWFIMSRAQFEAHEFKTVGGLEINKPDLQADTISIVVRKKLELFSSDTELVLFEAPIDLNSTTTLNGDTCSLLLESGYVVKESEYDIAYLAAYFQESGSDDLLNPEWQSLSKYHSNYKLCRPIVGAEISVGNKSDATFRKGASNNKGSYFLDYILPPCPCCNASFRRTITAKMQFLRFNPNSSIPGAYYETRIAYDMDVSFSDCGIFERIMTAGMGKYEQPRLQNSFDFPIDVAILTGRAYIRNKPGSEGDVPLLAETKYSYTVTNYEQKLPPDDIDLNADGIYDITAMSGDQVNVWFNQSSAIADSPDLTRLPDYDPDLESQGLLEQISRDDLKNTDIYIYRMSNNLMIASQEGIPDTYIVTPEQGVEDTPAHFSYQVIMRSPYTLQTSPYYSAWERQKSRYDLDSYSVNDYHLRPGEKVKVILINRATGYIGTEFAEVAVGEKGTAFIHFTTDKPVEMRPPNLKIKAEREYSAEIMDFESDRKYLIGFEGSGLDTDDVITITTEWYDHDGSPLPDDLPGYTGRLAKVVDTDCLDKFEDMAVSYGENSVSNFPVRTGFNTVVVTLPQTGIDDFLYYIHVSGEPAEDTPDFSTDANFEVMEGAGTGALQYRPGLMKISHIQVNFYSETDTISVPSPDENKK